MNGIMDLMNGSQRIIIRAGKKRSIDKHRVGIMMQSSYNFDL